MAAAASAHGVIERLRPARPQAKFLELVHRLDRDTSGVLLVAKKRAALIALHAQLREGNVDKRYYVLVRGKWRDAVARRRAAARALRDRRKASAACGSIAKAGVARTIFRRVRIWPRRRPAGRLLEAELETGRTHQIRVHLTHLGFPLAGDDKYGDFAWNKALAKQGLKRMFLHAHRDPFAHPRGRRGRSRSNRRCRRISRGSSRDSMHRRTLPLSLPWRLSRSCAASA